MLLIVDCGLSPLIIFWETSLQNLFGIREHHDAGPDIGKPGRHSPGHLAGSGYFARSLVNSWDCAQSFNGIRYSPLQNGSMNGSSLCGGHGELRPLFGTSAPALITFLFIQDPVARN